ncbi:hypothetical protein IFM89_035408 [Coptis chinensis]|uniref:Uncharacterized protein n=1 Tax=Coptis chinensis TaxID=261450 RepID=A0A835HGS3_9MAGN|nr:hypothetical protein IFM89_035408 [Coptis chinensis]
MRLSRLSYRITGILSAFNKERGGTTGLVFGYNRQKKELDLNTQANLLMARWVVYGVLHRCRTVQLFEGLLLHILPLILVWINFLEGIHVQWRILRQMGSYAPAIKVLERYWEQFFTQT